MGFQIKRRLILVFAIGVLFPIGTSAPTTWARSRYHNFAYSQTPADWGRYKVSGEEFSALFPVMPGMLSQTTYPLKLNKARKERIISAYTDGVVFVINSFENPKRRQSLDEVIAEFQGQSSEAARKVTLGGFDGREYSSQTANAIGVSQFFITDKHVYLFRATGSPLVNAEVAIRKFISSLRLEKGSEGMEVVEGLGEQAVSDPLKPGENGGRVLTGKETTHKAIVVMKPEPSYTEAARQAQITGTVVLRAVFSSSGVVTQIRAVSGLPQGLTERAIMAARQIKFIPAIKDGHFVSMWIQLEYNFNLY